MNERSAAWVRRALVAVTCLPIVTAVIRALRHDWFPIGDSALLYVRVADVLTTHHPWLGSWTSASLSVGEHMNNPGPLYDDLIAVFGKVLSPGPAAAIGVASVNIAAVVAMGVVAHRLGGDRVHRWVMLAAAALTWTMGSELLIDIWQAHALLLPFLLLIVLLVGVAADAGWCLPWAVVVASLLVQTHISYAYVLAVLVPVAVVRWWLLRRARPHRPWRDVLRSRRALVWGIVLALVWSQTLIEQVFGTGKGNLSRLASNAGGGTLQVGTSQALGISARLFALPPWWLQSGFSTSVPSTKLDPNAAEPTLVIPDLPGAAISALLLAVIVAVLVAWFVRHRRQPDQLLASAALLAATSVVGSVIAISRLTVGPVGFAAHHVRWIWPLAIFVHVTLVAMLAAWAIARFRVRDRIWQPVVAGASVVFSLAAIPYVAHPEGPVYYYDSMPTLRRVIPHVDELAAVEPVLYDMSNLRPFEPYSATIMMELQHQGIEFRVDDETMVRQLGEGRRADGTERAHVFQLQGEPAVRYEGPACLIVLASDLSDEQQQLALARASAVAGEIADGTIDLSGVVLEGPDVAIADVLDAAIAGDVRSAQRIVDGGYLIRWYRSGQAVSERDLTADLELVDRLMLTAFGLFSEQDLPCPS